MTSKMAVWPVVHEHMDTLRDARTNRYSLSDMLGQFGVPLLLGAVAPILGFRLWDAGQVVQGAAILAGFSFGLAIYVFQLRMEAARDPRIPKGAAVLDLLDELFANVRYSILIGIAVVVIAVAAVAFHQGSEELNAVWTGTIIAASVHFILTILMCMKRLGRAYDKFTI